MFCPCCSRPDTVSALLRPASSYCLSRDLTPVLGAGSWLISASVSLRDPLVCRLTYSLPKSATQLILRHAVHRDPSACKCQLHLVCVIPRLCHHHQYHQSPVLWHRFDHRNPSFLRLPVFKTWQDLSLVSWWPFQETMCIRWPGYHPKVFGKSSSSSNLCGGPGNR